MSFGVIEDSDCVHRCKVSKVQCVGMYVRTRTLIRSILSHACSMGQKVSIATSLYGNYTYSNHLFPPLIFIIPDDYLI